MRRLLVAVDGSEPSNRACKMAADIAGRFGAKLVLAHVIPPLPYPSETYGANFESLAEIDRKAAEAVLKQARDSLAGFSVEIERRVLWGSPADVLAELANADDIDCVVIGSRGRGSAARALLGSTSNQLLHLCTKPVLVVR